MTRQPLSSHLTETLVLFLFSIPALVPLFTAVPTHSADGLLHLYRLVQLDALWRDGVLFSRWLPDLAYGYGMPLFTYYAPLVYYLTLPLHLLGAPFTLALNLSLEAALFAGALGMFSFARAVLQSALGDDARAQLGAFVAALAFLYSPYLLFNALHRANLAEQWALAFAPFALWRFLSLIQKPNLLNASLAVLTFAAVMLSHNVTAFLFAPLLAAFALASVLADAERARRPSRYLVPLCALLGGLALSAFFWLPALLERDFVQIARVIVTPDFDYRFNFVPPPELVSLLPRADTGRLNTTFPSTLGIVQALGAGGAVLWLALRSRTRRSLPLLALALMGIACLALMLSFSKPVWDNLSLLEFVQLPMRLRGLAALCLAPLVGIAVLLVPPRWPSVVTGGTAVLLVLTALPVLYPRYAGDVPRNPALTDMFAYEARTGTFGTTSFGEYLPVWVQNLPDKSPFEEAYARGEPPDRFVIPDGITLCGEDISPVRQTLCARSDEPWHAIFRAFYLPGWVVRVDDAPVPVAPTPRTGLITFDVTGSGMISVAYEGTPVERAAEWVSLASAVLVVSLLAVGIYQRVRSASHDHPSPGDVPGHPALPPLLLLGALALALLGFKFVYLDRVDNFLVAHFDGGRVQGIDIARDITFHDELRLLGYDVNNVSASGGSVPEYRYRRGENVRVALYWRALPALKRDVSVYVHLTDPNAGGAVVAQKDNLHPGNLPAARWDLDAYVQDIHQFQIPPTLPPGAYDLRLGVYDPQSEERLSPSGGGDEVLMGKIVVRE